MRAMLRRIILVIFVLLLVTAVSGFLYMQKHPLGEGKSGAILNFSGKPAK